MSQIFEPGNIGKLHLKNRFIRSATWEAMATDDGAVTPDLCHLMAQLAKNSVGLIITGHAFVSPEGQAGVRQMGAHDDSIIAGLKKMAAAVHAEGGTIVLQLAHAGCQADSALTHCEALGPSPIRTPQGPRGRAMTMDEVENVIDAFGRASRRAKEAGFDGVQIHGAHGYLISQFLSPFFNKRLDRFGGDFDGRVRMLLNVVERIRHYAGPDYPLLVKINSEDFLDGGLSQEAMVALAVRLEKAGVDAIELSGGTALSGKLTPVRKGKITLGAQEAYYREAARRCKSTVGIPIALVGGIRSVETAEGLLKHQVADYIALSRPLICEPHLVRRWQDDDRRPSQCLSDNLCFTPVGKGGAIYCVTAERAKKNS